MRRVSMLLLLTMSALFAGVLQVNAGVRGGSFPGTGGAEHHPR